MNDEIQILGKGWQLRDDKFGKMVITEDDNVVK